MPRKIDPKFGLICPDDPPEFRLTGKDIQTLWSPLEIKPTDPQESFVKDIEYHGQLYLSRRMVDEDGPTRAEVTHALSDLVCSDNFQNTFRTLNFRADAQLLEALWQKGGKALTELTQDKSIVHALHTLRTTSDTKLLSNAHTLIKDSLAPEIKRLKNKGGAPRYRNLRRLFIELLRIYYDVTQRIPTHSDMKDAAHTGIPLSPAGKFIERVVDAINESLDEDSRPQIRPTMINSQLPHAIRQFKKDIMEQS